MVFTSPYPTQFNQPTPNHCHQYSIPIPTHHRLLDLYIIVPIPHRMSSYHLHGYVCDDKGGPPTQHINCFPIIILLHPLSSVPPLLSTPLQCIPLPIAPPSPPAGWLRTATGASPSQPYTKCQRETREMDPAKSELNTLGTIELFIFSSVAQAAAPAVVILQLP